MRDYRIFLGVLALLLIIAGATYWFFTHRTQDVQYDVTLSDLYFLNRSTQSDEVLDRLGTPSRVLGSGIERKQYDLADGRVVELIFNSGQLEAWILDADERTDYFEIIGEAQACDGTESVKAIPDLISSLENGNPVVRKEAAEDLGCLSSEAVGAIPSLVQTLGDEKRWVRNTAAWALGQIGPKAIPALIQALGNEDINVRCAAAWALGYAGAEAAGAIPALVQALGSENESVREAATWALGQIGLAAVPTLVQIVGDQDGNAALRKSAAMALGYVGPEAEEAIPVLIHVLEDESREVRIGAEVALWHITGLQTGNVDWWKEWWEEQQK